MKTSCLLFFCILWSISSTDVPMSCVKCAGENENSCHGIAQKCSSAKDECISLLEVTRIEGGAHTNRVIAPSDLSVTAEDAEDGAVPDGGTRTGAREISFFMRFCGNCSRQKTGFVRFDKGVLRINATCCSTNKCTPISPIILPDKVFSKDEKVKGNGIRCKSCFATNARNCDCNAYVNCIAGETRCISRYMSATEGHHHVATMRGCTTADMCEVIKTSEISMKVYDSHVISVRI
ncbi:unnamed protein product [Ranitomeya imitator]|uniref:UPAR/Ly6 domain-containing protein n=1 Tax=Ranitomeya imitator TaxID=111125 RepID=A0ABN9LV03_9NEOB|nr:unnamed protein product [Ranitomeya imitator]